MSFSVRRGTDPKFPSVRVRIDGYQDEDGNPQERQIALVFRHGEDEQAMHDLIDAAVEEYISTHPRDRELVPDVPEIILNYRGRL